MSTPTRVIRVILVDDHKIIRDGIRAMLDAAPEVEVVAEADNGRELMEMIDDVDADMVIMDVNMPQMNGIEATIRMQQEHPDIPVLALSMHEEVEYITKMLQAGAYGYILKNAGQTELLNAINKIAEGEKYFSSDVSYTMMMSYIDGEAPPRAKGDIHLTNRETEIIKLIANEMTNQEIADKLEISLRTVDTHRRNLLQKLGVKNTAGLVKYAMQNNLVQ